MATPRKFSCVVAVAKNGGIGKNNSLPWRLSGDMKHFAHLTSTVSTEGNQNAVIMGRKTWESIPEKYRPLPHRLNIVLSKNLSSAPKGAHHLCPSLHAAFDMLSAADDIENIFVIGGAAVYKEALLLPGAWRLYITQVLKDFDCDVHFPDFDKSVFKEISVPEIDGSIQEEGGIQYKFEVFEREV